MWEWWGPRRAAASASETPSGQGDPHAGQSDRASPNGPARLRPVLAASSRPSHVVGVGAAAEVPTTRDRPVLRRLPADLKAPRPRRAVWRRPRPGIFAAAIRPTGNRVLEPDKPESVRRRRVIACRRETHMPFPQDTPESETHSAAAEQPTERSAWRARNRISRLGFRTELLLGWGYWDQSPDGPPQNLEQCPPSSDLRTVVE